ncbi:hypothetical protein AC579_7818 [Lecanosticta acicola]|uniref:Uncharacterized protein n=1 Tax=Lecanosticta acicola TaxID=111012 RepID=A0AAI8YR99_9PEZI|nr:hypothetical protein AC579_7818 [Lecanosticta acicola]
MSRDLRIRLALVLLQISSIAVAQDGTTTQDGQDGLSITSPSSMPSSTDDASHNHKQNTGDLVQYYFVFLALIICVAGLAAFLMWRRRRKMGAIVRASREDALERDLNGWDSVRARRRYWQGRWRSVDGSREEGLNEHGEAPPPYVPKTSDEEGQRGRDNEPAVPLQTLSREQAGLKPPDYTEVNVSETGRTSTASRSSNTLQPPQQTHREI